jgi:hypothetical protein
VSVTPSITPTQQALAFLTDVLTGPNGNGGYINIFTACANGSALTGANKFMKPGDTAPVVGHFVYNDSGLTSLYDGGGNYHLMYRGGTTWAVKIGNSTLVGQILDFQDCSTVPSVTPSMSITPSTSITPSISVTPSLTSTPSPSATPSVSTTQTPSGFGIALGSYGNSTNACAAGNPSYTIYTTPGTTTPLAFYTTFYNDLALTSTFNGGNNWYKVTKFSNVYAVQINGVGVVQNYVDCSTVPLLTPSVSVTPPISVTPSISTTPPAPSLNLIPTARGSNGVAACGNFGTSYWTNAYSTTQTTFVNGYYYYQSDGVTPYYYTQYLTDGTVYGTFNTSGKFTKVGNCV